MVAGEVASQARLINDAQSKSASEDQQRVIKAAFNIAQCLIIPLL